MALPPGAPINAEPQRAAPPRKAPPGEVLPTAAGGLGGATSATANLPLRQEALAEIRRSQLGQPEFRGAWVTRFDWIARTRDAGFSAEETKQRIVQILDSARDLNLNAVVWQVRADCTTLYPSQLEPWSQQVGGKDPGFDPVKMAIEEAHKRGLEFHAYINPIPCTEERTSSPASRNHIWYKHCTPEASPNWLVYRDGKPDAFNEYLWLNPNLPEVQAYLRRVIMDFVTRYDVDGLHYDRIRFPSHRVSDDPWSKARFETANPGKLEYNRWQADNISRMLSDLYAQVQEVKPRVKTTAAVWGIYDNTRLPQGRDRATGYSWTSSGLQNYMQDSVAWANRGCMDALIPMIYWNMGDLKPDYDELLEQFTTQVTSGRHVYGGQRVFDGPEMLRQAVATRLVGGLGTCPFTLMRISRPEIAEYYKKYIYPDRVPVPPMPWKEKPVTGTLIVVVKDHSGKPVVDAQVTVGGHDYVALSSADGLCAILGVKPGRHTVTIRKGDSKPVTASANITAGKVTRLEGKTL